MLMREAAVLAMLLVGGLCCPPGPAAPAHPHAPTATRNKRSMSSPAAELGALLSTSQDKAEAIMEELLDDKRHLKSGPSDEHLFWVRSGECPDVEEGTRGFFCPTPDSRGKWRCITEFQLCDHMRDCPNGEDEQSTHCLFFSVIQTHFSKLTKSLLLRTLMNKHNHI